MNRLEIARSKSRFRRTDFEDMLIDVDDFWRKIRPYFWTFMIPALILLGCLRWTWR